MKRYIIFAVLLFAALTSVSFTACSDSNDDNNAGGEKPNPEETEVTYNDLSYFQNAIIEVDTLGNFLARTCGEVLNVNEPHHLYVGVESFDEAKQKFLLWLAPDVTVVPVGNSVSAQFTDEEGHAQGTVYFKAASANGQVAEVTASAGTQLLYFDKVTFLLNSAWPVNASAKIYHLGDVITYAPNSILGHLYSEDKTLKWVCIRESGNGVTPMFVTITNREYNVSDYKIDPFSRIKSSSYCPAESKAKGIANVLGANWSYWSGIFKAQGIPLESDTYYWIDNTSGALWFTFYHAIEFPKGELDSFFTGKKRFLLKIDWLDDSSIYSNLVGTNGSAGVDGEDYQKLFDGAASSKWCSHLNWRTDGVWFVEFKANIPLKAVGYKLTTASDAETYPHRNPKVWRLLGRNDEEDEWEEIDNVTNGDLPAVNGYTKSYSILTPRKYLYYRWEISDTQNNKDVMQIACFSLVV